MNPPAPDTIPQDSAGPKQRHVLGIFLATFVCIFFGGNSAQDIAQRFADPVAPEPIVTEGVPIAVASLPKPGSTEPRAAVRPGPPARPTRVELSLVLDLSYSLERNHAFDELREAVKTFLDRFDESLDRVGIVTYSTTADEAMSVRSPFKAVGRETIHALSPISDTNTDAGLAAALDQLQKTPARDDTLKVVLLITDGRPTAFSDTFWLDGPDDVCSGAATTTMTTAGRCRGCSGDSDTDGIPDCYHGVISAFIDGSSYRGLFDSASGLKVKDWRPNGVPRLTVNGSTTVSIKPKRLPNGEPVVGNAIRTLAAERSEARAAALRENGYTVFAVGFDSPLALEAADRPDFALLQRIANARGVSGWTQPKGEALLADDPAALRDVLDRAARRVLARVSR